MAKGWCDTAYPMRAAPTRLTGGRERMKALVSSTRLCCRHAEYLGACAKQVR